VFFVRQDMGVLEVELTGELSPGFVGRLRTLVEASGIIDRGIVFDMSRVSTGDPDGLWELVSFLAELDRQSIPLHIRKVTPRLRSLLRLVGAPGLRGEEALS